MVNFSTDELRLIAQKRSIKNYQNISRKKLLSTLDKSECNSKNILQNGLEQIAKLQNLSQNELEQITRMKNLPQNELEKIPKMRHIKNYKKMSKVGLLIALLKSKQSPAELYKIKSNNAEIGETKKFFNEIRIRFSKSNIKEIRKYFYEKEKGIENEEHEELKKVKKDLKRLQEKENLEKDNQDYVGIKNIKNLFEEDYYKPIKVKGAFNDNYTECKSRGDKDKNLSLEDSLDIIRPYLRDMINNHKDDISGK